MNCSTPTPPTARAEPRRWSTGNRGRRPHNSIPADVASTVVRFATTRYPGANHTHLAWHEGESRWLIGHVGRHLTNTKT